MSYDERTHQYLNEEDIMKDNTGKETESSGKHKAVNKLAAAFAAKLNKEDEEKEEKQEAEEQYQSDVVNNMKDAVDKAIEDIEANGYKSNFVRTDAYGNVLHGGVETENQKLLRVLQQRRYMLEGNIRMASRNPQREEALIAEYKEVDRQLRRLEKAIKKSVQQSY